MDCSAQARDHPLESRLRFLNVVLFSLPQFVNLVEVIEWERNNLAGVRISRKKNVLAFLRDAGVSEDERMRAFFVPRELRPFKDVLMVECAEYGRLARAYYEQYDVLGRATIICDLEGKPLIPTVIPKNMKGGTTAIFQFYVGTPFCVVQALCGATGKKVGLIELYTSAFDKTNPFVWIIARRSLFVSGELQHKNARFAPALAAAFQRCFIPFPEKPSYTAGMPVSWF